MLWSTDITKVLQANVMMEGFNITRVTWTCPEEVIAKDEGEAQAPWSVQTLASLLRLPTIITVWPSG